MSGRLDRTCDSTEEWIFLNYHKDILKKPDPMWHFDRDELNCIAIMYYKLQRDVDCDMKEELPSKSLSIVLHKAFGMPDDKIMQRIFTALDQITSTVSLRKWIAAMSLFLRGSFEEKIDYCFRVYDLLEKQEIRRDQMVHLMRNFVYKHQDEDVEEAVKDLVDIVIRKMDIDRDGIISYEDYKQAVVKDPMLLECFGQCLPDRRNVNAFLTTFTDKIKDF
jgi:Ca2+-binding EF-hand superfamily protein